MGNISPHLGHDRPASANAPTDARASPDIRPLAEADRSQVALVGGKGAHLGELSRIEGVRVPDGFCVSTAAFERILAATPSIAPLLERLSRLGPDEPDALRICSADLRAAVEAVSIPDDLARAIAVALAGLGPRVACAVRSSATAEDLPTASFAGQQDTYLNVRGADAVLGHVRRCWASLFNAGAVAYRLRHGIDHRRAGMAVVVQRMRFPRASGLLFTADPFSGHRRIARVEACLGLGEALVSGRTSADAWAVRDDTILSRTLARKTLAVRARPAGGTQERPVPPERQSRPALADAQVLELVRLGRRIEAHFGAPQDIEWCLDGDGFHIVQSRPITTLFPVPDAADDAPRVYLSVGHQQMMTEPMRPLGLSLWRMLNTGMREAGGRLFMDVTAALSTAAGRARLLATIGQSDPLTRDALQTLMARDFVALRSDDAPAPSAAADAPDSEIENDPAIVAALIAGSELSLAATRREVRAVSGPVLFERLREDLDQLRRPWSDTLNHRAILAGMEASAWLNTHLHDWLGEKHLADRLTRSAPGNITSEMGLDLLDVADAIRPHPQVVAFLERATGDDFLDALPALAGGREARQALQAWLDRYGMRCPGEIDITVPRWRERPSLLLPVLLGNVRHFEAGAARRRFAQGREEARRTAEDVLRRLRALPDGARKAEQAQRSIDRVRVFMGYREYPKYAMVCRFFVYRQALLAEAERLVRTGVLRTRDDSFYLSFDELDAAVRTQRADLPAIDARRQAFAACRNLAPPRVLTSEGECIAGAYRRDDLPDGALAGLAVSAGTVEGRARVVLDMADARFAPGDILVTRYTDPSWTPSFVSIAGLVTEVGGLMTHGAVIAREYGLPAVVGVEHATARIRDGQRIRVHGTEGYIELLDPPHAPAA